MPNSTFMSSLDILIACIKIFNSFSYLAKSLMVIMYLKWLIFSWNLLSLYPYEQFLSMWLSGITSITKLILLEPRWNITQWFFASVKLFPLAINSSLQVFMVFSIKLMNSSDILYILRQCIIQLCGTKSYASLFHPCHYQILPSCITLVEDVLIHI